MLAVGGDPQSYIPYGPTLLPPPCLRAIASGAPQAAVCLAAHAHKTTNASTRVFAGRHDVSTPPSLGCTSLFCGSVGLVCQWYQSKVSITIRCFVCSSLAGVIITGDVLQRFMGAVGPVVADTAAAFHKGRVLLGRHASCVLLGWLKSVSVLFD